MDDSWRKKKAMAMAMAFGLIFISVGCSGSTDRTHETALDIIPKSMSFQECYAGCFILCAIQPTRTLSSCGFECLMDCIIPQRNDDDNHNSNYQKLETTTPFHFCSLGCASVQCTNISTLNNPGAKQVSGCVGSCSGMCKKSYINI